MIPDIVVLFIGSVLLDVSKFVVDFLEILTEVKIEIHGLLSDAFTVDTCSVTDEILSRSFAS